MRMIFIVLLVLAIISCTKVEIKDTDFKLEQPYIRTTGIGIEEDIPKEAPKIEIITQEDAGLVKGPNVTVHLKAYNFKVVPVEVHVKEGEGHFHVWLGNEKRVIAEDTVTFENVASGKHTIVAELVKSNHSSLNPKIIQTRTINVESPALQQPKQEQSVREYTIESDDKDFYPNKIRAKVGDTVVIHFKFRDNSIYYAGLDVKGPFEDVKYKLKGEQPITREFTMKDETKITSYWPSSGVRKADLIVEVEK